MRVCSGSGSSVSIGGSFRRRLALRNIPVAGSSLIFPSKQQQRCQSCFQTFQVHGPCTRSLSRSLHCRAFEHGPGSHKDPVDDYVEVQIESVKSLQGTYDQGMNGIRTNVVNLRVSENDGGGVIQVHIGESESTALLQEIKKQQKHHRPATYDMWRNMLLGVGVRVTKVRITEIIQNTYYARIFLLKPGANGAHDEVDIDARPSDAINLAVRFGAPIQVNRRIASIVRTQPAYQTTESNAEIMKSVKELLASFEDPTIMYAVQKEVAIKEQRYEDALDLQKQIHQEMTHNPILRLIVAIEAAVSDGRLEEAARLRDEYRKAKTRSVSERA